MSGKFLDGEERFWFHRPIADRLAAAHGNSGVALESLVLGRRAYNCLRRSELYDDVRALMLTDESIWVIRNLGVKSVREIDAALKPLFDRADAEPPALERTAGEQIGFENAIRSLAELGDYDEKPWFAVSLARRAALADRLREEPANRLGLSEETIDALRRLPGLGSLGGLIGVGDGIVRSGEIDTAVLREIHSAVVRYTGEIAESLDQRDRWLAVVDELRGREDLVGRGLADLGLPASLVEALPGLSFDDLKSMSQMELVRVWAGVAMRLRLRSDLLMALESIAEGSGPISAREWAERWRASGYHVLPEGYHEGGEMPLHVALVKLLRHLIVTSLGEDEWAIVQHRKGLLGAESFTLQQIGDAYGLSRERIRQREARALKVLSTWLSDPGRSTAPARVHPHIERALGEIHDLFASVKQAPQRHSVLLEGLSKILGCGEVDAEPILDVLAKQAGVAELHLPRSGLENIWTSEDDPDRSLLRRRVLQFHDQLTRVSTASSTVVELTIAINDRAEPSDRVTVDEIERYSPLCSTIEHLQNGRLQGRFEHLATRAMQLERVLEESGEPMHVSEILRVFNHHGVQYGGKPIQRANLSNHLAVDKRFVPIGRSGIWAMADWPDVETGTLLELMERCFIQHNRPLTADEISTWVGSLRPVGRGSVLAYLSMDDRFAKIDRERWGLSTWDEAKAAQRWTRRRVADFVAKLFSKHSGRWIPYARIRDALMEAADVPLRAANTMLNTNIVIDTFHDAEGVLQAEFQRDYIKQLEEGGGRGREGSVLHGVRKVAARALQERPDHAMPLNELRNLIMRELGIPSASVYSYVARIEDLVTEPRPLHPGKLVRWVGEVEADQSKSRDAYPVAEEVDKG